MYLAPPSIDLNLVIASFKIPWTWSFGFLSTPNKVEIVYELVFGSLVINIFYDSKEQKINHFERLNWLNNICRTSLATEIHIFLINALSTNPTKWSNTLTQFVGNLPMNCLSEFDHFVVLALNRLMNLFIELCWIYLIIE